MTNIGHRVTRGGKLRPVDSLPTPCEIALLCENRVSELGCSERLFRSGFRCLTFKTNCQALKARPTTMIMPRFTIRTGLVGVTFCALVFVVAGMALRGETWAWGITIGLVSLLVTLAVHAAWFGLVWTFARLPAAQPAVPVREHTDASTVQPNEQPALVQKIEARRNLIVRRHPPPG